MIDKQIRFEIIYSIKQIRSLLKEAEKECEISPDVRKNVMAKIEEAKRIIFSDHTFRNAYYRNEHRKKIKMVR